VLTAGGRDRLAPGRVQRRRAGRQVFIFRYSACSSFLEAHANLNYVFIPYFSVDLGGKSHVTLGRLRDNDIPLDHASISRFHCVVCYGEPSGRPEWKDGATLPVPFSRRCCITRTSPRTIARLSIRTQILNNNRSTSLYLGPQISARNVQENWFDFIIPHPLPMRARA
jgi:hypothetical protein